MEQVVRVARLLREEHGFRGYIHLKTIPDADPALLAEAGRYADRLSINVELPSETSLSRLAPEKDCPKHPALDGADAGADRRGEQRTSGAPRFAPAGQSTQVIVGADASSDRAILEMSKNLYGSYGLAPGLLRGVQPDSRRRGCTPVRPGAAAAGTPAVSGRLADAVLRVRGGRTGD